MKKQTAVEWLIDELNGYDEDCEIFRIAKAMEKEQIIKAVLDGYRSHTYMAEQYFNETYGGDK
jgi:uncharacterized Fe-S cluster-containing protein